MNRAWKWLSVNWPMLASGAVLLIVLGSILFFRIDSLLPGVSNNEISQLESTSSFKLIAENPLGLPQKALQYLGLEAGFSPIVALRSASALLGLVVAAAMYYVLANWHTRRIAILGAALFISSSWFLSVARSGTDAINFSLLFVAFACIIWLQKSGPRALPTIAGTLAVLTLLYIPGLIWFIAALFIWRFKWVMGVFKRQKLLPQIAISLVIIVAIFPLAWSIVNNPELGWAFLGLPHELPTPLEFIKNLGRLPLQLFIINPEGYEFWLGTLPLISWFTSIMFVIGTYAYFFKRKLDRTWSIVLVFAMGAFLIALGGPVNISLLLPFVYLIATGGIALMLQQWFTVFPRNPFARGTGLVMMTAAVVLSVVFSFNQYFIAWPNTPETKEVFVHVID